MKTTKKEAVLTAQERKELNDFRQYQQELERKKAERQAEQERNDKEMEKALKGETIVVEGNEYNFNSLKTTDKRAVWRVVSAQREIGAEDETTLQEYAKLVILMRKISNKTLSQVYKSFKEQYENGETDSFGVGIGSIVRNIIGDNDFPPMKVFILKISEVKWGKSGAPNLWSDNDFLKVLRLFNEDALKKEKARDLRKKIAKQQAELEKLEIEASSLTGKSKTEAQRLAKAKRKVNA